VDLARLKARNAANVTSISVGDLSLHLRKLTAADGMAVGKAFQDAGHTDPNGPEPTSEQFAVAYAILLSKTICDEAGNLTLDSDEGRAELQKLDFQTAQQLGEAAQKWSGLLQDESKKN
jgi:hypothetical protein